MDIVINYNMLWSTPVWLILVCFADLKHHSKQAGWWLANDMSQHFRGDQCLTTLESPGKMVSFWLGHGVAWYCLMFILIVRSLNLEHTLSILYPSVIFHESFQYAMDGQWPIYARLTSQKFWFCISNSLKTRDLIKNGGPLNLSGRSPPTQTSSSHRLWIQMPRSETKSAADALCHFDSKVSSSNLKNNYMELDPFRSLLDPFSSLIYQ